MIGVVNDCVKVYNWRARRSGKGMTIEGIDGQGRAIKLTEIDCIDLTDSGIIVGRRSAQACCILSTKRLTLRLDVAKD